MGVNELIGYYSKKYKKVNHKQNKGAHVIGNYANGAKVCHNSVLMTSLTKKLGNWVDRHRAVQAVEKNKQGV